MSRNKKSSLLSDDENLAVWEIAGKYNECYVTAVVSKFLVKPKFNFPENESAVLCLVLDVRTNSFLLRLCSIKRKSIIWEQEIETKMHIKNKNNLILLDATIGKIKIEFQSSNEAQDITKVSNEILKMKDAVQQKTDEQSKTKKGSKRKKVPIVISDPIGFRHLEGTKMEILNKIPENLRNSKASEAIITQFFEEHDVNKMIEEEKSKKVAPSRPACLPPQIKNDSGPSRPSRPPPIRLASTKANSVDDVETIPLPPAPKIERSNTRCPPNAPIPPPAPAFIPGPPPPPMPNLSIGSATLKITPKDSSQNPPPAPVSSGIPGVGDLLSVKLKPAGDRVFQEKNLPSSSDNLMDSLARVLEQRLKANNMDDEEEHSDPDESRRNSFFD